MAYANGDTATYGYNEAGRRTQIGRGGSRYHQSYTYDADGSQTRGEKDVAYTRTTDGRLVSQWQKGETYWYHLDGLGSTVAMTDESGKHYNPGIGRFLTQDTYKGSAWAPWTQNLYAYVGNNPVNFVDPTGHAGEKAVATNEGSCEGCGEPEGVTVESSWACDDFRCEKLSDGTMRMVHVNEQKKVDSIYVNADGTYTIKYVDGSFAYTKDWIKPQPGTASSAQLCLSFVCLGATSASDGTIAPFLTVGKDPFPASLAWTPSIPYNGDPTSLQHPSGSAYVGTLWVGGASFDANTGQLSPMPLTAGTPQAGVAATVPLPLLRGPVTPTPSHPNYGNLLR